MAMGRGAKRTLIGAGLVGALLAGAYAAAPAVVEALARRSLQDVARVQALDVASVGWRETRIGRLHLNQPGMSFEAQRATVQYELWPPRITGIAIEQAGLSLAGRSAGRGPAAAPPLPDFPLHIEQLSVEADTPWGPAAAAVSVRAERDASGRFAARLRGDKLDVDLAPAGPGSHELTVRDDGGAVMLTVTGAMDSGLPVSLQGMIDPQAAAQWLQDTRLVPAGLKTPARPYGIRSDGVQFTASLRQNLDFEATVRGRVTVRDKRDAASRVFEALDIEAKDYSIERSGASWSGSGTAALSAALGTGGRFNAHDPDWKLDADGLRFSARAPGLEQAGVRAEALELSAVDPVSPGLSGRLRLRGVTTDDWPGHWSRYHIDGEWVWQDAGIHAHGSAAGEALPDLQWSIEAADEQGNAEVRVNHALADLRRSLQPYVRGVARKMTIGSGKLGGAYRLQWGPDRQRASLDVSAGPADVALDEMEIRGLSAQLRSTDRGLAELELSITAPRIRLAAGTVMENFEAGLRLAYPALHLDAARTELFSGRFEVRPTRFDLDAREWTLTIDINGLSLEEVMALFELESTQLTGSVAGPVRLVVSREGGIAINEGELSSVEPGVLKFTMEPGSDATAGLDNIAIRALENFQYDELSASVLYSPGGEYRIRARIVGKNPGVLGGHPIALNPDIRGTLPALFRAFFITGDFNRAVLRNIQEQGALSTPDGTSTLPDQ